MIHKTIILHVIWKFKSTKINMLERCKIITSKIAFKKIDV